MRSRHLLDLLRVTCGLLALLLRNLIQDNWLLGLAIVACRSLFWLFLRVDEALCLLVRDYFLMLIIFGMLRWHVVVNHWRRLLSSLKYLRWFALGILSNLVVSVVAVESTVGRVLALGSCFVHVRVDEIIGCC